MNFIPIGGFPPMVRANNNQINNQILNTRGFSNTNIVSIADIMNSKKKENLFIAFGSEDENGIDYSMGRLFTDNPIDYDKIDNDNSSDE